MNSLNCCNDCQYDKVYGEDCQCRYCNDYYCGDCQSIHTCHNNNKRFKSCEDDITVAIRKKEHKIFKLCLQQVVIERKIEKQNELLDILIEKTKPKIK